MSILKSTCSGYEYYYVQELLRKSCEFRINGEILTERMVMGTRDPDGITVEPFDWKDTVGLKLYSKIMQRGYPNPPEWFLDMPIKMFSYISLPYDKMNYQIIIENPFDVDVHFKTIIGNVSINCEIPNIEQVFKNCKIQGTIDSTVYDQEFLLKNRICTYYGKDYMGF